MDLVSFTALVAACAPLVHPTTAQALVAVESGFNPHAIGVVGGSLERQPRSLAEALSTTAALRREGLNFSVGLAQINAGNFQRLGLTARTALLPCRNLGAMQVLLVDCFSRAAARSGSPQRSLRQALSCYYSGNFVTGFVHGYVSRVEQAARPVSGRLPSATSPTKEFP